MQLFSRHSWVLNLLFEENQIRTDETINVIGFNNTPLAAYQHPPLASVDVNAEKLGYYAAKLLIHKLKKVTSERQYYIIDTFLQERNLKDRNKNPSS